MRRLLPSGLLALSACRPSDADPQLVAQWLRTSLAFARSERLSPPVASRLSAYASIALYEGYAADPRSRLRTLAGQVNGLWSVPAVAPDAPVDGATVAAEAERVVLDSLFREASPSTRRTIDSLANAQVGMRRRGGVGGELAERSRAHGRALGQALLWWAEKDGFVATRGRPWRAPTSRGRWVATAPTDQPTEPHWGTLRTFALRDGDECAPPPPPAYSERPGSDFWKMGRELLDSVLVLSDTQMASARYWADAAADAGTAGFHWNSVVNQMIARRRLTADQSAEAYMLASVAMADAFIGCWKQKYRSLVARPVTYVRRVFDPTWSPLVTTPPDPEYPSAHAALSGAATTVLIRLLGDTVAFTDSTPADIGAPARSFRSFTHALEEDARSRVYAGIHFPLAIRNGTAQGACIGERVLGRLRTRATADGVSSGSR